jgi:hypothetical protein
MITAEQIPDEVVEAAARLRHEQNIMQWIVEQPGTKVDDYDTWEETVEPYRERERQEARAALAAGLAAWPGSEINQRICSRGTEYIILPLSQEHAADLNEGDDELLWRRD